MSLSVKALTRYDAIPSALPPLERREARSMEQSSAADGEYGLLRAIVTHQ